MNQKEKGEKGARMSGGTSVKKYNATQF